jgi:hypothetical protein
MTVYQEKASKMQLPPLPWTHEALGEELYCQLATQLGYFNPKAERKDYRPTLDPSPFAQFIGKGAPKPTTKE